MFEQSSIFDFMRQPFEVTKKVRLITLFSGYDSQAMALKRLGVDFEHYKAIELDKYAIASLNAVHGTNFEPTDICTVHGADLEIVDKSNYTYLLTYSYPCFVGETMILTHEGFKQIKDVKIGDKVLSHDNKYHEVIDAQPTGNKELLSVKGMCIDEIKCTKNHKFYVKQLHRFNTRKNGVPYFGRKFDSPEWIEAEKLSKDYYLGFAINQNAVIPEWSGIEFTWKDGRKSRFKNEISQYISNPDFWWLIGAYVGDGWLRSGGGIIICGNDKKIRDIKEKADGLGIKYYEAEERTANKLHFTTKELSEFVKPFGRGAANKCIPGFVFDLPINLLKGFLDGYMNADGSYSQGLYKAASVSRTLIYGIGQIVAKVYNRPFSIYRTHRKETCVIEGRTVNQKDSYNLTWKMTTDKQDKAFYEDGYIWFPIKSIKECGCDDVYDITVEDSHSFTANGVIVHNCTSLSLAGKQEGMDRGSGTASSLLWEVERILKECKELGCLPDILQMENVTECHNYKHQSNFREWTDFLESLGYTNYLQDLNGADYLIPQHRERAIMISLLGNYNYKFPEPVPLETCMADYLEDVVDDKFYIKSKKAYDLIVKLVDDGTIPNDNLGAEQSRAEQSRAEQSRAERYCVDATLLTPKRRDIANVVKARCDNGISQVRADGNCVVENRLSE